MTGADGETRLWVERLLQTMPNGVDFQVFRRNPKMKSDGLTRSPIKRV